MVLFSGAVESQTFILKVVGLILSTSRKCTVGGGGSE